MPNNYYQKIKEKLQKEARERYQNLSEEEKDKKRQYARERHRNLSEEDKEEKPQYERERYKHLLENVYRKKTFRNARNKDYLSTKYFLLYLPYVGP